jgi:hypothetical protein
MEYRRKIRVAYIPATVAGHPIALSKAVEQLGFEVRLWQLEQNSYGYGKNQEIFRTNDNFFKREIKRVATLMQILSWADVVHCTFGSSLAGISNFDSGKNENLVTRIKVKTINQYELLFLKLETKLYKLMKKKLIIDYQGDDIRQRSFQIQNYKHSIAHVVGENYYNAKIDNAKIRRLKVYLKAGFKIRALNPDLLNYLPENAKFRPYSSVELKKYIKNKIYSNQISYVFVHAPSNRSVKGTEKIISVLSELQQEGYPVQLRLVEGVKNHEALKIYGDAFMAIDQINAGWYGGFAVECMAQGVPVISYIRESDMHFLPPNMKNQIPIINACACNLKNQILDCIRFSKLDYETLSEKSVKYVNYWHNPDRIAAEVIEDYL